jgi:hypothetical protein
VQISKNISRQIEDVSDDAYLEKNAVKLAKEFQQIKGEDDHYGVYGDYKRKDHVSRRQTIHRLTESHKKPQFTGNLDSQFRKRIDSIAANVDMNGKRTNELFLNLLLAGLKHFQMNFFCFKILS